MSRFISGLIKGCILSMVLIFCGCSPKPPQSCMTSNQLYTAVMQGQNNSLDRIRDAIKQCETCYGESGRKTPTDQEVRGQIDELRDLFVVEFKKYIDKEYGDPTTIRQYEAILAEYKTCMEFDNVINTLALRVKKYKKKLEEIQSHVTELIAKLSEARENLKWTEALSYLQQIEDLDPDQSITRPYSREQIIADRDRHYIDRVEELLEIDQWQEALGVLEQAKAEEPLPVSLDMISNRIQMTKRTVITREVKALMAANRFLTAQKRLAETGMGEVLSPLLREVKQNGTAFYKQQAIQEKEENARDFHAYIAIEKSRILSPQNKEVALLHEQYRTWVKDAMHITGGVLDFTAPQGNTSLGIQFANGVVDLLTDPNREIRFPSGVTIAKRDKMSFAIEKRGFEEAVELIGLDYQISGDIDVWDVEQLKSSNDTIDWVSIPSEEVNPVYVDYMKSLGADKSKWPEKVSEKITKQNMQQYSYKKGIVTLLGKMQVTTRVRTIESDDLIIQAFTVSRKIEDKFQDGVPRAKIETDLLELPSVIDIKQDMKNEMIGKVAQWICELMANRHMQYLSKAKRILEENGKDWDQVDRTALQALSDMDKEQLVRLLAYVYLYYQLEDSVKDSYYQQVVNLVLYDLTE